VPLNTVIKKARNKEEIHWMGRMEKESTRKP
jgi:hypothetical protein